MSKKIYNNKTSLREALEILKTKAAGSGLDTSDATATAADILQDKTAYVAGEKITGTIAFQAAKTITPSTLDQVAISSGYYASGDVVVVGDVNLVAENIKSGASIFGIEGSYEGGGGDKPTLFTPSISINNSQGALIITDENGGFADGYYLYSNDELVTILTSKTATLTDYIEHTETLTIKVQAVGVNFNSSEFSNIEEWVFVGGTPGIAYSLSANGTVATCTGLGDAISKDIVIASSYEGAPVLIIDYEAFKRSGITSVVIPQTVTNMQYDAFASCSNLKAVYIFDLEQWCKITFASKFANPLANGGSFYLNNELVTELNIPETITTIKDYAFSGGAGLTSVTIPSTVNMIGHQAFSNCGFTSVRMPNSISTIESWAFRNCSNLKRLDFSTHTSIPKLKNTDAFEGTNSALQIKVPASLIDDWKNATNWSNHADKIVTEFTN